MSNGISNILNKMVCNPSGIRFNDLSKVCEHFFGKPRNSGGSHFIYKMPWPGNPRINIQNTHEKAKGYQVQQVLKAIDKLLEEGHHER